jgi:hypothetical protein
VSIRPDENSHNDPAVRLQTLATILLVHSAAETWYWALTLEVPNTGVVVLAAMFTAFLALGQLPRYRRAALWLLTLTLAIQCCWTFPFIANHTFLRLIVGFLLAFLGNGSLAERRLSQVAIGWTTVVILFYTGFQKLLYGTYYQGQYLSYLISLSDRFRLVFATIVPADELQRLQAIGTPAPGSGPYTVDSVPFLILANLVYLAEMGLAAGLVWHRTRRVAVFLTLGLMLTIELGARELFFGVLFCNLILMLHPADLIRRWLPITLVIYGVALVMALLGIEGFLT